MAGVAMNGSFVLRGQTAVFAHVFLPGTSFLEKDGTLTNAERRIGETAMAVEIGERVPQGVVYAAFHHPASGANAIATEFFDWAANGPEYPTARNTQRPEIPNWPEYTVTTVQIHPTDRPSAWQQEHEALHASRYNVAEPAAA